MPSSPRSLLEKHARYPDALTVVVPLAPKIDEPDRIADPQPTGYLENHAVSAVAVSPRIVVNATPLSAQIWTGTTTYLRSGLPQDD